MSTNYDVLTADNRELVDEFIDFLVVRQKKNQGEPPKAMIRSEIMNYTVFITWDDEAEVWVATSVDVIGLVLESESLDNLIKRVKDAIPELLELNNQEPAENIRYICSRTQSMVFA